VYVRVGRHTSLFSWNVEHLNSIKTVGTLTIRRRNVKRYMKNDNYTYRRGEIPALKI
jgi:hypothetical protein